MKNYSDLTIDAFKYLDIGDIESAEDILKILRKEKMTSELKYIMGALLIEIGTATQNMDYINEGIKNFEELEYNTPYAVDYNLGNGFYSKYKIMKDKRNYLTKNEHLLTKAKRHFLKSIAKVPIEQLELNYVNLGNTYDYVGRTLDALECYEKAPNNAYSRINKAIGLFVYSTFHANTTPILKDSYDCFKSVLEIPEIPVEFKTLCSEYMKSIENTCGKQLLEQENKKTLKRPSNDTLEGFMTNFCLDNKLYLYLCNFCQRCDNAIGDTVIIPNMIVKITDSLEDDPYLKLSSQLNQIKMDYATSRFLLMLSQSESSLLNLMSKNMTLTLDLSYEENNTSVQLLKDSFAGFYNILDKISHLINIYFNLQKDPKHLNFRNIWNNKKGNINGKLSSLNNSGLSALYDIHLELEKDNEKFYLRILRNNLTHNFRPVKLFKMEEEDLTYEELKDSTIELAKIVKNAIIYLIRAININERKKYGRNKDKIIPKINSNVRKL